MNGAVFVWIGMPACSLQHMVGLCSAYTVYKRISTCMHAGRCVYSLWQGRGAATSSTAPGSCIQASRASSPTSLLLFVLVLREEDTESRGLMCFVVLQYTWMWMWPQVVGKLFCFFSLFEVNYVYLCVAEDVVCALTSHTRQHKVYRWCHFLSAAHWKL